MRESKQGNQAMILLNWLFQDEMFCGVILRNFADIISRRDDRYVALGWCILGRRLVEYDNVVGSVQTSGNFIPTFLYLFGCFMHFFSF